MENVFGGAVEAEREIEGGLEVSTCRLPAVLTCDKGLNTPRLPTLKGIMAAKSKPLETKSLADLGLDGAAVHYLPGDALGAHPHPDAVQCHPAGRQVFG